MTSMVATILAINGVSGSLEICRRSDSFVASIYVGGTWWLENVSTAGRTVDGALKKLKAAVHKTIKKYEDSAPVKKIVRPEVLVEE